MKKVFKVIIKVAIIGIILMCLVTKLDILDFSDFRELSIQDINKYSNYYFNQLSEEQKRIYIKISKAVEKESTNINYSNINSKDINDDVNKALTAYINDNPEVFYLSNNYSVLTREILGFKINTLSINYDYSGSLKEGKEKLENEIEIFLQGITSDMSDYEKEIIIHDKLVKMVKYFNYENVANIPNIKHSAYGALVEHEAVCDGYSKAFKILLERVGVENIIAVGSLENVAHAWNVVKIDNEYYHVDTTSDDIEEKGKKYIMHVYFNLTDNEIKKTHEIGEEFDIPKCSSNKYNYYNHNGYTLSLKDNVYSRLKKIIKNSNKKEVLEFKTDGLISSQTIIDTLYDLNFNNWKTNRLTNISYNQTNNVYIFRK